jgi:hypothetical protein
MIRTVMRVLIAMAAGAAAGASCVIAAYARHPALTLEMDRDLPRRVAAGFYPVERGGETTFAWTSKRADVTLKGLSRASEWICTVAVRGGRADPATQPVVDVAVDGISTATAAATNEFRDVVVRVPSRATPGLTLSISSSRTIVPGPSDPRELGVQVDRVVCGPSTFRLIFPPRGVARAAALGAAAFGGAIAIAGSTVWIAVPAAIVIAVAQALPLSAGAAPYIGFADRAVLLAVWIAVLAAAMVAALDRWRINPLTGAARFVVLFSGVALYLKLLGLLHPSKLLVDAVFHAHRLEWVLGGRYFFTQPMPGGVSFPYAIGLYVFAAPWSAFTNDHVTLLRVVVCAAEVVAGALLYPVIASAWGIRGAAAIAVVLFSVVPLPYGLVGNANLTNAFGQSVALATVMTASMLSTRPGRGLVVFFGLCALAFLSHVSTFALLGVTLTALTLFYWWSGGATLSRTAWTIAGATLVAALLAVVIYYGHFTEVYRTALRVRSAPAAQGPEGPAVPTVPAAPPISLGDRVGNALTFTVAAIGWPILVLAGIGVWRVWAERLRDRAVYVIAAWAVAYVAFLGVAVMRVDAPFQRYAAEFFGRVLFATYPAAVMLAACGSAWAWRAGWAGRGVTVVLLGAAVRLGVQHWAGWFQ